MILGIGYFKGKPTDYIIKYVRGQAARKGTGQAFWYILRNTNIVAVPTNTTDVNFIFNEVTGNFQDVTLQGQYTYRVIEPEKVAAQLDFTVDPRTGYYLTNQFERLPQRITNIIQVETREEIGGRDLEDCLRATRTIAGAVLTRIQESAALDPFGVELLGLHFVSAKPTPEVAKALEAEYRESLLRRADEAIFTRRAEAVEKERKIKENELNTDITLEQQREQLVQLEGGNLQREAELRGKAQELEALARARALEIEAGARVKAMEAEAKVYEAIDPTKIAALSLRELSSNAEKVAAALMGARLGDGGRLRSHGQQPENSRPE